MIGNRKSEKWKSEIKRSSLLFLFFRFPTSDFPTVTPNTWRPLMDTGTPKIIAKKGGGIGWLIFNQPEKHNAMSFAMWQAIPKVMADFEADPPAEE